MEITKKELIEKINSNSLCKLTSDNLCTQNTVYDSAKLLILDYISKCDDNNIDIDDVYNDITNTLCINNIIDYFRNNYSDIDEVLNLECNSINLNNCSSVDEVITTLVYKAYEIALCQLLFCKN